MKKITTLIIMLALSFTAWSQWSTNPAVNNIISDLTGEQVLPKVGLCPNGNIYIGFFSNVSGYYNVRLQYLDSQGNEIWAHNGIMISQHPTDTWVTDWDMTVDLNNHAILTFCDIRNAGNTNTVAYRISPDGTFDWGADGIALSNSTAFNAAPKVTCTAAGNAVFAWSADDVIIMQKINPAGVKQWGDNGITLSSADRLNWPQLLPVGNDEVILKYFNDSGLPNAPTRYVYAQRYNASGTAVWTTPTVISNAGGISAWTQIFPFINDGSDGFYMAWHDDRDNNQMASVFVQHVNANGQIQLTANGVEASTNAGTNHFYAFLANPAGSSDIFVFWNEMNGLQSMQGISGQKISSTGTRQWGNSGIAFIPITSSAIAPQEVMSSTTDMVVLYDEGNSAASQLKAMRIGTDGSFLWPSQFITVSSAASSKVHTVMSPFANNQWIVSWEDNRTDADDVYAQNLAIDGSLGPYDPQFGTIQGHVTLTGGTGNVTQVVVSAAGESTFPDPSGDYILQVPVGTYDVTASLAAYYPQTVTGVQVLENQSTNNIDFDLLAVPTTGFISGTIELSGGTGDVTQAIVSAGDSTTHPDANGNYILEVSVNTWEVEAALDGYVTQLRGGVVVEPGLTTPDIDFILSPNPLTGFLYGTVTIEGDMADVTQVTVTVDTISVHPDVTGDYIIEIAPGDWVITVGHPYTQTVQSAPLSVTAGGSTEQDFNLLMLRTDLVVTCVNQYYFPLSGTVVHIEGPEDSYNGTMENDSLVFQQVPYGNYSGDANYYQMNVGFADTIIDQTNHDMQFLIFIDGVKSDKYQRLSVSPNPVQSTGTLQITADQNLTGILSIYNSLGQKVSELNQVLGNQQVYPVSLLLNNQNVKEGMYFIQFISEQQLFNAKLIIKD